MEKIEAQKLAERIALLLQENERKANDFAVLRSSLEKINARLDIIENKFDSQNSHSIQSSASSFQPLNHPSREKFQIPEAISNEEGGNYETEKPCPFEPTGKLCDHCSMCGSLGF